jgi:plastocyanin
MTRKTARILVALFAIALLATGCSDKKSVGNDALLEGTDESSDGTRLGETTTTTAAPVDENAATTAPPETAPPTTAAAAPAIEVSIGSDTTAGGQFQPRVARVPSGAIVRFVNNDTVERSVVADGGAFDSGPIAPGGVWDWVSGGSGTYNYSDGTRPYAVGSIEVV